MQISVTHFLITLWEAMHSYQQAENISETILFENCL